MLQTQFIEQTLGSPRQFTASIDSTVWIWYLSITLIVSASINVFMLGRYYQSRLDKKR